MFELKHDIQINLKNEKEVFRLIRLLVFTFVLSAALMGLPDYIWNMTWYHISLFTIPWLIAVPAIIDCVSRKLNWREVLGDRIFQQIILGIAIGIVLGVISFLLDYWTSGGSVAQIYGNNVWIVVRAFCKYVFVVGPSEELIYRVAIMGSVENLISRYKWIAPLAANSLFALSHLFQHGWKNVAFAFVVGAIYTMLYYKWKRCGYIMIALIHGMFDFTVVFVPYVLMKI